MSGPKTNFWQVACGSCGNEQKVFSSAATAVKCIQCGETLAMSSGGKAKLTEKAKLVKAF